MGYYFYKKFQTRPLVTVELLTTRVKGPDNDNYKKLGRVIEYLIGEPEKPLTLEADNTHVVKWKVDTFPHEIGYEEIHGCHNITR